MTGAGGRKLSFALLLLLSTFGVQAQTSVTNTAIIQPPANGSVFNPGTACQATNPPGVYNSATQTCTASDTDSVRYTLTVVKSLSPGSDAGQFIMNANGTQGTAGGNGATASNATIAGGTTGITFGESAASGTNLANYSTAISCVQTGTATTVAFTAGANNQSGTLTMPNANVTCTLTNTRSTPAITLSKSWTNGKSGDTVGLSISGSGVTNAVAGNSVALGATTNASANATAGSTVTLAENFTTGSAANYTTALACTSNGNPVTVTGSGQSYTMVVPSSSAAVSCTYTNSRIAQQVNLAKTWAAGSVAGGTATATTTGGTNNATFSSNAPTNTSGTAVTMYAGDVVTLPAETFGGTANSASYGTTVACAGGSTLASGATGRSVTISNSTTATTCTYTNTPLTATLQLAKAWDANSKSGDQVTIGATTGGSSNTNSFTATASTAASSNTATVTIGNVITLPAETGANVGNYTTALSCTGGHTLSGTNGQQSNTLTITSTNPAVCTYTNTRIAQQLNLAKVWGAGATAGHTATATTTGGTNNATFSSTASTNTTGAAVTVYAGDVITLPAETFGGGATSASYATTVACSGGTALASGATGRSITVSNSTTATTCTYTNNTNNRTVTLTKQWSNGKPNDAVTLTISGSDVTGATAGSSTSGGATTTASASALAGSTVTVAEAFTTGLASNYATTLNCIDGGSGATVPTSGSGTSQTLTVPNGGVSCTYTNTRKTATVTLQKTWSGAVSGDAVNVTATGLTTLSSTSTGSNTTTGTAQTVRAGDVITLGETFTTGNGANYTQALACTGNTTPLSGNTLTVNAADTAITCTYTNTRIPADITVSKSANPASGTTVKAGDTITYTLTATVADGATTAATTLTDTLGTGLTFGTLTAPAVGSCTTGQTVVCNLPVGTVPGTYTFTYTAKVNANATTGSVNNSVAITGNGGDPTPTCTSCTTNHIPVTIDAVDDNLTSTNGATGNPSAGNAYTNDTLNGQPVQTSQITGSVVTPATSINGGPVPSLNPATGVVSVPAGTPAGSYTITYQICDATYPTYCDTAKITVPVSAAVIDAVDDSYGPINGVSGGSTPTVLANDTLNGAPVSAATVTLASTGTAHNGTALGLAQAPAAGSITMNPDGTITIAPGTTAGTYKYTYEICEKLNPANCDTAVATVVVSAAPIVANPDSYTGINGATGATTASTIVNDTLNGVTLTTGDIGTKVTLTPGAAPTTTSGGLVMNADGTITVQPGTPAGTYVYPYTICEKLNPTNCSTANATVMVNAAPIVATNDTGTANGATGGQAIATVLTNDTLNGAPATTSTVTIAVAAGSTVPSVMTFDTTTGAVDVKPNTPAGTYTFNYTICEKLNPANCSTATVTVTVSAAPIVANPDSYTGINGATGTPNAGNAYGNDTLNGQPVNVSQITGSVITPATSINGGPVPSLDPATGVVSVPAGTPAGDYQISYKICEKLNPTNCSTTMIDVKVSAAPIDAVDDNYSSTPINGINGGSTPTALANDTLNGQPVKATDVTLTPGTAPTTASGGIVMNADGTITVKPNTPAGTYTYSYKICEKLNPTNCDTANATVVVSAAPIVATPDSYPGINGATGNPNVGNAYTNDTLNGAPVDPANIVGTVVTPATPINGGPVPSLDPATGVVSVPAGTPAGDYQISYKICEKLNPTNCSTTTIDVKVLAAPIVAKDDSSDPINGGNGGSTPSVLGNDTLNGQPAMTTTVTLKPGTAPTTASGGIVMNPDGTITVKPGTPAGTYAYPYTICEKLNPSNCATATATVKVTAPVIVANPDAGPAMPAIDSATGGNTPSVIVNDSFNGVTLTTGDIGTKVTLTPGASPNPGLAMNPDGTITVKAGTAAGTYTYPYTICDRINPSNCASSTATVVVTPPASMRVTKTATPANVHVGDLVRYTLTIENTGSVPVNSATLVDTPPAGFSYVDKTMTVVDRDNKANMIAIRTLTVSGIDIDVGKQAVVTYMLRVGAGIHPGTYTNQALMQDRGRTASNVATADVQVVGDPLTDDTLILGTVFDDRDGDGWQDSAAASGLHVQGGFAPAAYVANSTTVDRGEGPKPEADHSSPMLHGIALGELKGRQSDAEPVEQHRIVIRQRLRELAFNDDFVLTTKEGVSVRMDAAGKTRVETTGDAAKGLIAADLRVERKIAQVDGGYQVDYVISNAGVDERGIPGVRIASVEGLLVETDQFGRFHLAAIPGGGDRGRNFILKVDPSTLPPGTTFTTDNPLVRRVTPGLPVRFDFGAKLPASVIEGDTSLVEMQLGEVFFAPGSAEIRPQYASAIEQIATNVREHKGAEVVINANGENAALAYARAQAMKQALLGALDPASAKALVVNTRTDMEDPDSLVAGVSGDGVLLGTVLFDTDQATIRPEYDALLDKVAAGLEKQGGGVITLTGHADVRASHDYNTALGMRRAKAVYEALAKRLKPDMRAKVRVDINNSSTAPVDAKRGK